MLTGYTTEEYIQIGFTILCGALIGWLINRFYFKGRVEDSKSNLKNDEQFSGKMNTANIKKNRVIFSPEVCENDPPKERASNSEKDNSEEKTESESETDEQDEDEEEEQMPQFNNRKITNTQNFCPDEPSTSQENPFAKELSDADKMNVTIGKLHGKLATAQLKAKTRQIAAEMSNEEKEYEAKMKNNQMESIMRLMMQNQEKFGMSSDDIKEQMNLYNF
ncbi:Matrix-remodeling-associated protein 7 helical domain-containing protein [Caenorhabditis elegans]|uniref:Matrix-remodeling-associated protein 7 n=1 Tax=Caenorhabditis elegans TaxID=6239 RepID=Q17677_CAEEL|nr:Matrix-remodeling-associated protein 7 [Caenorhabditis elegans]CAA94106.2 Matrix-remodeling-associated protein 7 [Caenorhabditis elegans]|eukprot:NP_510449.2 Uncharacterized protein CELE_C05G5.3 [Caenorhabditis elegans]